MIPILGRGDILTVQTAITDIKISSYMRGQNYKIPRPVMTSVIDLWDGSICLLNLEQGDTFRFYRKDSTEISLKVDKTINYPDLVGWVINMRFAEFRRIDFDYQIYAGGIWRVSYTNRRILGLFIAGVLAVTEELDGLGNVTYTYQNGLHFTREANNFQIIRGRIARALAKGTEYLE